MALLIGFSFQISDRNLLSFVASGLFYLEYQGCDQFLGWSGKGNRESDSVFLIIFELLLEALILRRSQTRH